MPDNKRQVDHADIVVDSNLIRPEPDGQEKLMKLAARFLAKPESGSIYFTLYTLAEVVALKDPAVQTALLKNFQSLYLRFGNRVRLISDLEKSIAAEWSEDGRTQYESADIINEDVTKSIEAGKLVGRLEAIHEVWKTEKEKLKKKYASDVKTFGAQYEASPQLRALEPLSVGPSPGGLPLGQRSARNPSQDRLLLKDCIERYGTIHALEQCESIAAELITIYAKPPSPNSLEMAKKNHANFPCTWTFALLTRLAEYSSMRKVLAGNREWVDNSPQLASLLKSDINDYVDACIVASGGQCGRFITNEKALIEKINFLYDAQPSLIRLQAFDVDDALINLQ